MSESDSRPLTHALEALLGGLGPLSGEAEQTTRHRDLAAENESTVSDKAIPIDITSRGLKSEAPMSDSRENITSCPVIDAKVMGKEQILLVSKEPAMHSACTPRQNKENEADTAIKVPLKSAESQKLAAATSVEKGQEMPTIPGLFLCGSNFPSGQAPRLEQEKSALCIRAPETATPIIISNNAPPPLTTEPLSTIETSKVPPCTDDLAMFEKQPEWEVDLSPIESSSDDSSSDSSSSDESEEDEDSYKLLSPEEQAKILMAGDGGSDDEGRDKSKGSGGQLRTKNEVLELVIPKPDVVITEDMPIIELGVVEQIVDNILLIKAKVSGEYRVLESGSVLCLSDRTVFGVVAETMGRVQEPLYSVMFSNASEIGAAGLSIGLTVFYSENHSTYVFTKTLRAVKGSDASNINDEEVGDDEIEFSDDEAEAEHKKQIKQKRIGKRDGKAKTNCSSNRNGHPLRQSHVPSGCNGTQEISYDDNDDDDGPYKTLARPAGYADHLGRGEDPQEETFVPGHVRPYLPEKNKGRGRGDRKKGRDNGRLRGSQSRLSSGARNPPKTQNHQGLEPSRGSAAHPPPMHLPEDVSLPLGTPSLSPFIASQGAYNMTQTQEYPFLQTHHQQWPQFFPQINQYPQQNQYQADQNTLNWINMAQPLPTGVFINPAFFNQQNGLTQQPWNHQSQQTQEENQDRQ